MQSALSPAPSTADGHDEANKRRLFEVCVLALAMTSMSFILRGGIAANLEASYFASIDRANAAGMVSQALGAVFLTFALTLFFGSALIDAIGMRNVLIICAGSFIVGTTLVITADSISSGEGVFT